MGSTGDMNVTAPTNKLSIKDRFDNGLEALWTRCEPYVRAIGNASDTFTQAAAVMVNPKTYVDAALRFSANANDAFKVVSGLSGFREEFPTVTLLGGLAIGSKQAQEEWDKSLAAAIPGSWMDFYLMRHYSAEWFNVTASTFAAATPAALVMAYSGGQFIASGPTVEGIVAGAGRSFLRTGDRLMACAMKGTPGPSGLTTNGLLMPVPAVAGAVEAPAVGGAVSAAVLPSFGGLAGPIGVKTRYTVTGLLGHRDHS